MRGLARPIIAAFGLWVPVAGYAQGIPMSPDFLPLDAGNLWRYEIADDAGRVLGRFEVEILEHRIVEGVSYYVFSRFPLLPGGGSDDPIAVRFDREQRRYVYTKDGEQEEDLFPARGVEGEILETDDTGLPRRVRLGYADRALTLERGRGITGGRVEAPGGIQIVTLYGARVGNDVFGEASPLAPDPFFRVEEARDNVVLAADARPLLEVQADRDARGHRFVLRVRNPTDKLMAFDFTTSQSFDFVVTDNATGREVWQWARRMFFSQVRRSEAIRAEGQWEFGAEWNHRDNDLEDVPPGVYLVKGVLTSTTPFESEPVEIEVE